MCCAPERRRASRARARRGRWASCGAAGGATAQRARGGGRAPPLGALRLDLTPAGLHYLLVHYDIPFLDPAAWRLELGGHVATPLSLDLAALRSRPRVSHTVTLECAGNGRAKLLPRPVS